MSFSNIGKLLRNLAQNKFLRMAFSDHLQQLFCTAFAPVVVDYLVPAVTGGSRGQFCQNPQHDACLWKHLPAKEIQKGYQEAALQAIRFKKQEVLQEFQDLVGSCAVRETVDGRDYFWPMQEKISKEALKMWMEQEQPFKKAPKDWKKHVIDVIFRELL